MRSLNVALLVGVGGFLGSVLRYSLGGWVGRLKGGSTFPLETLVVNVVGCVVIGFFAGLSEARGGFSPSTRAFLFVGLLGGFTTFSAFGYESFRLMRDGHMPMAAASAFLQLALGIGGVWVGDLVARMAR